MIVKTLPFKGFVQARFDGVPVALIAVLAVMLMVLVSVSCASSDDVERYDAWPDQEEPSQDASRYGYRLIEVISKTRRM